MWCPSCRADVAAELSSDNRRMLCARCHSELGIAAAAILQSSKTPGAEEMERDARDLLSRWSSQSLLEPPVPVIPEFSKPTISVETLTPKPDHQIVSHSMNNPISTNSAAFDPLKKQEEPMTSRDESSRNRAAESGRNPQSNVHQTASSPPQNSKVQPPADDHQLNIHEEHHHHHHPTRRGTTMAVFVGQICAYAGVGLLTCGSVLVMWSFFGGPANYMPTGWLTAAVGQMLLFLGVVTLISNGMEQTIVEVTWRIDHLAEEVHHMGLALDHLEDEHRQARLSRTESVHGGSSEESMRKAA